MPRKHPQPWFRTTTQKWTVTIGGKQRTLSADKDEAFRMYHEMMARPPEEARIHVSADLLSVKEVLSRFLDWVEANRALKTFKWNKDHAKTLVASIPSSMAVTDLRPFHVTKIMDSRPDWSNSTKNGFASSIQHAMRWAADQGIIEKNPIPKVEKPPHNAREVVITPPEFDHLLSLFPDQTFRDVLITAWDTGCRPGELIRVEARHVDLEKSRWVFKIKESKGKKVARIVYLTERALEITRRLVATHPTGPLFRNEDENAWTVCSIGARFERKASILGRRLCFYNIRHSFATRMLLAGVDAIVVANLMGHRDTTMLSRHYSHIDHRPEFLLSKLQGNCEVSKNT